MDAVDTRPSITHPAATRSSSRAVLHALSDPVRLRSSAAWPARATSSPAAASTSR